MLSRVSNVVACVSTSFLLISKWYTLCGYTTFYLLYIHQLNNLWVVISFWLLGNAAMNTGVYLFIWIYVFIFIGYIPGSKIIESNGNSMFNILRNSHCFSKVLHNCTFPLTMHEGSIFCIPSPTLVIFLIVDIQWVWRDISLWL